MRQFNADAGKAVVRITALALKENIKSQVQEIASRKVDREIKKAFARDLNVCVTNEPDIGEKTNKNAEFDDNYDSTSSRDLHAVIIR